MKCWTGWITNWNQDCQEKYQQPQICRWYHSNGRKWRVTRASWWRWKRRGKAGLKLNIQKSKIMASSPIISWQIEGEKVEAVTFYFLGLQIHWRQGLQPWKITLAPWKKSNEQPRQNIKKQRLSFANKCLYSQSYSFFNSDVWIWELDYKESWVPKNWCFWTVMLEWTLESPLDCKEIKPVNPEGNQSWLFIGRTDVEIETPIFWPPAVKNWFIWKDPDAGKDWRWEEKGMTEDEMVGWHHQLNGHEFG